jgi:hypothetical protein
MWRRESSGVDLRPEPARLHLGSWHAASSRGSPITSASGPKAEAPAGVTAVLHRERVYRSAAQARWMRVQASRSSSVAVA